MTGAVVVVVAGAAVVVVAGAAVVVGVVVAGAAGVVVLQLRSFVLPEDGTTDMIMVGPGTGIAPFRAFLQQRELDGATGRNWLFFGDWTEEGEYYYREEMEEWKD